MGAAALGGLRVGELLALRWGEVDLAQGTMEVLAAKTEAGNRLVDLSPDLREDLAIHKATSDFSRPTDFVFPTSKGTSQNRSNVRQRVLLPAISEANRIRAERGVGPLPRVTMHDLRRTFVALLFEAGATVPYEVLPARASTPFCVRAGPGG